jgi:3-hydroxyisobutyrate dehydrogenase-like beta-hydroxyacid dehydrogenase
METIGFVGLGVMGGAMARHLLRAGHPLIVWNRTPEKAEPLRAEGALVAPSLTELAQRTRLIFLCVSTTEDVQEVISAMSPFAEKGTLFVDHSTILPKAARALGEELQKKEQGLLDAPVTGGSIGAERGTLTVFVGGREEDFQRALPYMSAYAKTVRRVGEQGMGQMMKMANQVAVALTLLSMAECLVFAKKTGLDPHECVELIGQGAGGSWSLENYGPKALHRDWSLGFSVSNQQKDLVYALATAREYGVSLPGTALVHQLLAALESAGRGGDATAALYEVLEALSGEMEVTSPR